MEEWAARPHPRGLFRGIAKGKNRMAAKSPVDGEVNQIRREEERIKEARAYFDICIMLEALEEPPFAFR